MADKEITFFNVKNISLRVVGFAGQLLTPNDIIRVVDDEKKINRKSVSHDPFIDFTDEEPTLEGTLDISILPAPETEPETVQKQTGAAARAVPVKATPTKAAPAAKTGATPTGAGWGKNAKAS
jgi:hypothetical protein